MKNNQTKLRHWIITTLYTLDILCKLMKRTITIHDFTKKKKIPIWSKNYSIYIYCDGCPKRSSPSPWKPTRITCTSSSRAGRAHLRLVTAGLDKPPQHTRWWDMSPEDSTLTLYLHLFQKAAFHRPAPAHEHGTEDSHWKAQAPITWGAQSTNPRHRDKSAP